MKNLEKKLFDFCKVYFLIEEMYPNYYPDFDYSANGKLQGLTFTLFFNEVEAPEDEFSYTIEEFIEVAKIGNLELKSGVEVTKEEMENFMVVYALFNNQMDKIIPKYNHEGWRIETIGIKESKSERLLIWEEVINQMKRSEIDWFSYEDLLTV